MKKILLLAICLFLTACASSVNDPFVGSWKKENVSNVSLSIDHKSMERYEAAFMFVSGDCGVGHVVEAYRSGQRLMSHRNSQGAQSLNFPEFWIDEKSGNLMVQRVSEPVETFIRRSE